MSDPFLGEIRTFGFNFAPEGWAFCNGQSLSIAQYSALYALLGVMYGGDGRTTFQLPNLQGRTVVGQGSGAGLTPRSPGQTFGRETTTLNVSNLPTHTHAATASSPAANARASSNRPEGAVPATGGSYAAASAATGNGAPIAVTVSPQGGSQPFDITAPSLVLNYCIALQGIFPPRS